MAIFILILAVLWAAFFAWPLVQRRLSGSRRDSVGDFSKRLTSIGGAGRSARGRGASSRRALPLQSRPVAFVAKPSGRPASLPMSPAAQRRRRDALAILGVAVLGTLLLAVVTASVVLWAAHILADALFVGYLVVLVQLRRRADQRRADVHFLAEPAMTPAPAMVLRRTASS